LIELVPGARFPERAFGPVTATDIVRYQGASGDMNPIHHDDDFARAPSIPALIEAGKPAARANSSSWWIGFMSPLAPW
jgi:acyl dehydratase